MPSFVGVFFALSVPTAALAAMARAVDADDNSDAASDNDDPLQKVVNMLEDMRQGITKDIERDKAANEIMDCWCETNGKEKGKAIEDAEAKAPELEAFITEAKASMDELQSKRGTAAEGYDDDFKSLQQAKNIRLKDSKAFMEEEKRLLAAIQATEQAVVVLSKHHSKLAQVRTVAHQLQKAKVLSLASLSDARMGALRKFLSEAQGAVSFLAVPGFQSYAPPSGEVFGILKQMKEDFEHSLAEARSQEKVAVAEFETLNVAKSEQLRAGKKLEVELDKQFAEFGEKRAQAMKELEDTKKQLVMDKEFLANVEKKCSTSDAEFETRMKDLMEEVDAVEDTIQIIISDNTFNLFDKTFPSATFLQAYASTSMMEHARRQRAMDALKHVANAIDSPELMLLVMRLHNDAFGAVIKSIDKMVAQLQDQQDDEVEHRDWCVQEMAANKRSMAAGHAKKKDLKDEINGLRKTRERLKKQVASTQAQSAETQRQMEKASQVRKEETADYAQTVDDQRLVQIVLRKAVGRLRATFSLAQKGDQQGAHAAGRGQNATSSKYERTQEGSRVITAIEKIIADSQKVEDEAVRTEQDAQAAYDALMKESNKLIMSYAQKVSNMSEALAKAMESLVMVKTNSKSNLEDLAALEKTSRDFDKACSFILKNFDVRQAARIEERDALKQAKNILAGMA